MACQWGSRTLQSQLPSPPPWVFSIREAFLLRLDHDQTTPTVNYSLRQQITTLGASNLKDCIFVEKIDKEGPSLGNIKRITVYKLGILNVISAYFVDVTFLKTKENYPRTGAMSTI